MLSEAKHLGSKLCPFAENEILRPAGCYEKLRPFVTLPAPG